MPERSPNCEAMPVTLVRYTGQLSRSFSRATSRAIAIPIVTCGLRVKRSWSKGIRNSAVQPRESTLVAASHTPSQDSSSSLSL